jgi:hypothetical protein
VCVVYLCVYVLRVCVVYMCMYILYMRVRMCVCVYVRVCVYVPAERKLYDVQEMYTSYIYICLYVSTEEQVHFGLHRIVQQAALSVQAVALFYRR